MLAGSTLRVEKFVGDRARCEEYLVRLFWRDPEPGHPWDGRPHWVDFEVHAVTSYLTSVKGVDAGNARCYGDVTRENCTELADPDYTGFVRWDGCMQVYSQIDGRGSEGPLMHFDSIGSLAALTRALISARRFALEAMGQMENW